MVARQVVELAAAPERLSKGDLIYIVRGYDTGSSVESRMQRSVCL